MAIFCVFRIENLYHTGAGHPDRNASRLVIGFVTFCLVGVWATYSGNLTASLTGDKNCSRSTFNLI